MIQWARSDSLASDKARLDCEVPSDLKRAAQHAAIEAGISLTDLVIAALHHYLSDVEIAQNKPLDRTG